MTELEQLKEKLRTLQELQYQLVSFLTHRCEQMFFEDAGLIDRVFPFSLALEAVRIGRYDLALRHLEVSPCR